MIIDSKVCIFERQEMFEDIDRFIEFK